MGEKIGTKIDDAFNKTERFLTTAAAFPVIGTVAGLAKVLMGVGQSIVGLVGGVFTSPARLMGNSKLNDRFWTHLKHGAGNMAAGTIEAIPLIGTGMYYLRMEKVRRIGLADVKVETSHSDKLLAYKSLADRDFKIVGVDDEKVALANSIFKGATQTYEDFTQEKMSNSKKHEAAEAAVLTADTADRMPSE